MATGAVISMAVTATGAAMGVATLAQCLGHSQGRLMEVNADATVKNIGEAPCRIQGGWRKVRRHATLIGDLLVVSRQRGSAEAIIPMKGAHICLEEDAIAVVGKDGTSLVSFWPLGDKEEIMRWAMELDPNSGPIASVPKMLSVTREQMEKIKAEAMQWEERITNARDGDPTSIAALEAEMSEREERIVSVETEMDGLKAIPKMLSLNRRQIAELETTTQQKDAEIAQLKAHLDGVGELPKMLSLNRRQIAELEASAADKDSEVAGLKQQLEALQEMPKQLSLNRKQVASLQVETQEKEGIIAALKTKLSQFQEMPKILSLNKKQVEELEANRTAKDDKIVQLEDQLHSFKEMPKILSLNRKQVSDLVKKTNERELQLVRLQRELQKERAKMRPNVEVARQLYPVGMLTKQMPTPQVVAA